MPEDLYRLLIEPTAQRYRAAGRCVQGFVRGKLRHDPVYRALLDLDLPLQDGLLLDIGCGRGIAMAMFAAAHAQESGLRMVGIEQRATDAAAARTALAGMAEIVTGDIRTAELPTCRIVLLIDVMLYLPTLSQDALLDRITRALEPGGLLIMREADSDGAWRFRLTRWAERLCAWGRGDWQANYHYRGRLAWERALETRGFSVATFPMSQGTPFANFLVIGNRSGH